MPVVYKSTHGDTPKDAVVISRLDASEHIYDSIMDLGIWKALPFRGGYFAMTMFTGVTATFTIGRFRKFFKVGKYGFITTAIPASYIPMIGTYVSYKSLIAPPLLLQEKICPMCLQVRAMAIQLGAGILYPFAASYLISYQIASKLGTYQAPQLKLIGHSSVRKEMWDIFKKSSSRLVGPLTTWYILHCALVCGMLTLQTHVIDDTLEAVEKKRRDTIDEIMKNEREKKYRSQSYTLLNVTS